MPISSIMMIARTVAVANISSGRQWQREEVESVKTPQRMDYHPTIKNHHICLICRLKGVDKSISVGTSASPGPLETHLKTHNTEYLEFRAKKLESEKDASSKSKVSHQSSIICHSYLS
jgi:hypothetical protein